MAGAFFVGAALITGTSPLVAQYGTTALFYAYVVSGAYGGVALIGAAVVIIRTGVFANWIGWAGLIIGLAAISSIGAVVENDPEGLFATMNGLAWLAHFLWIATVSIELIRSVQRKSASSRSTLRTRTPGT